MGAERKIKKPQEEAAVIHSRILLSSRYTQKNLLPRNVAMSVKAPELSTTISADEFHALEEKVYRTIELLKTAREGKAAAERDASRLRQQLEDREEEVETIRTQIVGLRKEREDVRGRVEKMLKQIDLLTESESEA